MGKHPRAEEGVVIRSACFSMRQLCCFKSVSLLVRNCSGFYVYKLGAVPFEKYSRVCGAGIQGNMQIFKVESAVTLQKGEVLTFLSYVHALLN